MVDDSVGAGIGVCSLDCCGRDITGNRDGGMPLEEMDDDSVSVVLVGLQRLAQVITLCGRYECRNRKWR